MDEQPATFINPDPDFGLATGLAQSLVSGPSDIVEGIGAVLAGEVWIELSDYGRIVPEHPVAFAAHRDPVSVVHELLAVLDRMLTACDGLEEALRVTRARDVAGSILEELSNPTTFEDVTQVSGQ